MSGRTAQEGDDAPDPGPAPTGDGTAVPTDIVWKRTWVEDKPVVYGLAGPGDGHPALFLHGWGLGQTTYRAALTRLADLGTQVFAPAMPGFGGTPDLPGREFSLAGYARWVERFLRAVKVDEPVLCVGHSFGGGVAIRFAHDHESRVRALVLVNSIGGSAWKQGSTVKTLAERPLWDWGLHLPSDILPGRQATKVIPVILGDALPNLLRNPRALWKVGQLARRADLTQELETLKTRGLPVVVLWGDRDEIIPRASFEAICEAAGTEGHVVAGTHSWLLADPERFGEVITNVVEVAKVARSLEQPAEHPPAARTRRLRSFRPDGAAVDQRREAASS